MWSVERAHEEGLQQAEYVAQRYKEFSSLESDFHCSSSVRSAQSLFEAGKKHHGTTPNTWQSFPIKFKDAVVADSKSKESLHDYFSFIAQDRPESGIEVARAAINRVVYNMKTYRKLVRLALYKTHLDFDWRPKIDFQFDQITPRIFPQIRLLSKNVYADRCMQWDSIEKEIAEGRLLGRAVKLRYAELATYVAHYMYDVRPLYSMPHGQLINIREIGALNHQRIADLLLSDIVDITTREHIKQDKKIICGIKQQHNEVHTDVGEDEENATELIGPML